MEVIAITGPASFIGRHLVELLSFRSDVRLRLLVHRRSPDIPGNRADNSLIQGDLLKPATLKGFLIPDCTVINLAYLGAAPERDNLKAAANLADACAKARVKRLVHCSTAVLVGHVPDGKIHEDTPCRPDPGYENTKIEMERIITEKARGQFDLAILRPTAVFGPGGGNLLKLADDLASGSRIFNYVKSCLFDHRRMNLVPVDHVVSALVFLAFAERSWEGAVFIVAADDHPHNTYREIEKYLLNALGRRDYPVPRIPVPTPVLSVLLHLAGRSNSNPRRRYDAGKLRAAGFLNAVSFEAGLDAFADWYRRRPADPAPNGT